MVRMDFRRNQTGTGAQGLLGMGRQRHPRQRSHKEDSFHIHSVIGYSKIGISQQYPIPLNKGENN